MLTAIKEFKYFMLSILTKMRGSEIQKQLFRKQCQWLQAFIKNVKSWLIVLPSIAFLTSTQMQIWQSCFIPDMTPFSPGNPEKINRTPLERFKDVHGGQVLVEVDECQPLNPGAYWYGVLSRCCQFVLIQIWQSLD